MRHGPGSDAQRLTPLGRFLRSTSLDELPELLNVLRGDMSLVGPRPLLMHYLPRYSPTQARRMEVHPGITGWAQINGRNALTCPKSSTSTSGTWPPRSLALDLRSWPAPPGPCSPARVSPPPARPPCPSSWATGATPEGAPPPAPPGGPAPPRPPAIAGSGLPADHPQPCRFRPSTSVARDCAGPSRTSGSARSAQSRATAAGLRPKDTGNRKIPVKLFPFSHFPRAWWPKSQPEAFPLFLPRASGPGRPETKSSASRSARADESLGEEGVWGTPSSERGSPGSYGRFGGGLSGIQRTVSLGSRVSRTGRWPWRGLAELGRSARTHQRKKPWPGTKRQSRRACSA